LTLEALGQFLCKQAGGGLNDYEPALRGMALGASSPQERSQRFDRLFPMVRRVRNDAMHQGAIARNATTLCVELALMLEDGLLTDATNVGDYMITAPIEAKLFESLGAIRRTLLMHSFSYLPVRDERGEWKLVSDQVLAKHLQGQSNGERNRRLVQSLKESGMPLVDAEQVNEGVPVTAVLDKLDSRPVLVVRKVNGCNELVGLVTAFDLL
jgi:CBS domain-containing protein